MNKEQYIEIIDNEFIKKNVLVIGDLMVDRYIAGKVRKLSPEAPVPVLDYSDKKFVAGGASNVVNNLIGLGAKVRVAGIVSNDLAGRWLKDELTSRGALIDGIYETNERPTTMKTRYTTKGIQLLRVDRESTNDISDAAKEYIEAYLESNAASLDAVVFSDYLKGVLKDPSFVKKLIGICRANNIFVAADSKTDEVGAFAGADIMTPNVDEVSSAVGIKIEIDEDVDEAGKRYLLESGVRVLLVTRGDKGISVFAANQSRKDFPAKDVEVFDVSGAGDTVISTITIASVCNLGIEDAVKLGNIAAGIVISKRGTVAIEKEELLRSINEIKNS